MRASLTKIILKPKPTTDTFDGSRDCPLHTGFTVLNLYIYICWDAKNVFHETNRNSRLFIFIVRVYYSQTSLNNIIYYIIDTYFERVSTPRRVHDISTPICSNSRFNLVTLSRAWATSDLSKSGSYFVLILLVLEQTTIQPMHTKRSLELR